MQRENFKCPKCKKKLVVGKRLHASYECPHCHYTMVLTREDVMRGWKPYRSWFRIDEKPRTSKNFKKFRKSYEN